MTGQDPQVLGTEYAWTGTTLEAADTSISADGHNKITPAPTPVELVQAHASGVRQEQPGHSSTNDAKGSRHVERGPLVHVTESRVSNDSPNLQWQHRGSQNA